MASWRSLQWAKQAHAKPAHDLRKEFFAVYLTLPWYLMSAVQKGAVRMTYKITDECTMCGTCVPECAFEAISEGDPKYIIDADACTDCGSCEAICASGAIVEG